MQLGFNDKSLSIFLDIQAAIRALSSHEFSSLKVSLGIYKVSIAVEPAKTDLGPRVQCY